MTGPLDGIRVLELAGIGPLPFAAMLLADLGADVVRVDRVGEPRFGNVEPRFDVHGRGRRSIAVDLKHPEGVELVLALCEGADVLLEGFRPGVVERLGLGPAECHARNPDLVYGRMTGWGREGPLARTAGHDINYTALAGALYPIGPPDRPPVPPLNLVADYGGGGMLLAFGIAAALLARAQGTVRGQVVDAAMLDGVGLMMGAAQGMFAAGRWSGQRAGSGLDGSAPWYRAYRTADDGYVAVGAIEPRFWALLLDGLGLAEDPVFRDRYDRAGWPAMHARLAEVFRTRTRDDWEHHFAGTDACVTPVLAPHEAAGHPHARARGAHAVVQDVAHPAPAPRFSATPGAAPRPAPAAGEHTDVVLREWGVSGVDVDRLRGAGAIC